MPIKFMAQEVMCYSLYGFHNPCYVPIYPSLSSTDLTSLRFSFLHLLNSRGSQWSVCGAVGNRRCLCVSPCHVLLILTRALGLRKFSSLVCMLSSLVMVSALPTFCHHDQAWIHCCMRTIPTFELEKALSSVKTIQKQLIGQNWRLFFLHLL